MLGDTEWLMRRIPVSQGWYSPTNHSGEGRSRPHANAFKPHQTSDHDGLSLYREASPEHPEFLTPKTLAARGSSPKSYYVARIRVQSLIDQDIRIAIAENDPEAAIGHVVLPDLNSANRKSDAILTLMQILADQLTEEVVGPLPGTPTS